MSETHPRLLRRPTHTSVCERVIKAVAATKDTDVTDLNERLYDNIDPDALEDLFTPPRTNSPRTDLRLTFSMSGCEVTIRDDDGIDIDVSERIESDGSSQ